MTIKSNYLIYKVYGDIFTVFNDKDFLIAEYNKNPYDDGIIAMNDVVIETIESGMISVTGYVINSKEFFEKNEINHGKCKWEIVTNQFKIIKPEVNNETT